MRRFSAGGAADVPVNWYKSAAGPVFPQRLENSVDGSILGLATSEKWKTFLCEWPLLRIILRKGVILYTSFRENDMMHKQFPQD